MACGAPLRVQRCSVAGGGRYGRGHRWWCDAFHPSWLARQVSRDQVASRFRHQRSRHDGSRNDALRIRDDGRDVGRRTALPDGRQVGPDRPAFAIQPVAAEAGQVVLEQCLGLPFRERRERLVLRATNRGDARQAGSDDKPGRVPVTKGLNTHCRPNNGSRLHPAAAVVAVACGLCLASDLWPRAYVCHQ
jgi:hypothetical protein